MSPQLLLIPTSHGELVERWAAPTRTKGLVVTRGVRSDGGYAVTHEASGRAVVRGLESVSSARMVAAELVDLADWTLTHEELEALPGEAAAELRRRVFVVATSNGGYGGRL